eukprot:1875001-Prymnesium_polylepis.1
MKSACREGSGEHPARRSVLSVRADWLPGAGGVWRLEWLRDRGGEAGCVLRTLLVFELRFREKDTARVKEVERGQSQTHTRAARRKTRQNSCSPPTCKRCDNKQKHETSNQLPARRKDGAPSGQAGTYPLTSGWDTQAAHT